MVSGTRKVNMILRKLSTLLTPCFSLLVNDSLLRFVCKRVNWEN